MALKIIAGFARGIMLETPEGRSMRPTAGKAREALFSSLGPLDGITFADIFAGSGAIGFEAASRGASAVTLLENDARHCRILAENQKKIERAGVEASMQILHRNANAAALLAVPRSDVWFFDPPYAETARFFQDFLKNEALLEHWRDALLIWELPDTREALAGFQSALHADCPLKTKIRSLGGVDFLWSEVRS